MKPVISLAMFGSREREIREEKGPFVFCLGGGGVGMKCGEKISMDSTNFVFLTFPQSP